MVSDKGSKLREMKRLAAERKKQDRDTKRSEREAKKAAREEKKAEREQKQKIMKMPAIVFDHIMAKSVLSLLDPDGKFSENKSKSVLTKIKQLGELPPRKLLARIKARKFQVAMISEVFDSVTSSIESGKFKKLTATKAPAKPIAKKKK